MSGMKVWAWEIIVLIVTTLFAFLCLAEYLILTRKTFCFKPEATVDSMPDLFLILNFKFSYFIAVIAVLYLTVFVSLLVCWSVGLLVC